MEKSLSLKLAARRQIRFTTVLAGLILVFMLGSMFVVKNPSGGKAAVLTNRRLLGPVASAPVVYNPETNISYLLGGVISKTYSKTTFHNGVYRVYMDTLVSGNALSNSECLNTAGGAAVFNPVTHKAYVIGGYTEYDASAQSGGDVLIGTTRNIAEVDLSDDVINASEVKCTWIGLDPQYDNADPKFPVSYHRDPVNKLTITGDIASFTARESTSTFFDPSTGKIYILGGVESRVNASPYYLLNDIFVLDTSNPANLVMTKLASVTGSAYFGYRANARAVFDPTSHKGYMFGGELCRTADCYTTNRHPSNDILTFDVTSNTITQVTAAYGSNFTQRDPAGVVYDPATRSVYILAGADLTTIRVDVLRYDIPSNKMVLTSKTIPYDLYYFSSMLLNSKIYMFGGSASQTIYAINPIYRIDVSNEISSATIENNIRVSKSLYAKRRDGADNTTYNPYALKKGDVIQVVLNITGQAGSYVSIADDTLSLLGRDSTAAAANPNCNPDPTDSEIAALGVTTPSNGGILVSGGKTVYWNNIQLDSTNGTLQVNYYCKVGE